MSNTQDRFDKKPRNAGDSKGRLGRSHSQAPSREMLAKAPGIRANPPAASSPRQMIHPLTLTNRPRPPLLPSPPNNPPLLPSRSKNHPEPAKPPPYPLGRGGGQRRPRTS